MTQIERLIRNNEDYKMITGQDLTHDNSSVINSAGYVDDINHIASNHDKDKLEQTAQDIYRLTKHLYNENNLMVNNLKTQILQVEVVRQSMYFFEEKGWTLHFDLSFGSKTSHHFTWYDPIGTLT